MLHHTIQQEIETLPYGNASGVSFKYMGKATPNRTEMPRIIRFLGSCKETYTTENLMQSFCSGLNFYNPIVASTEIVI